MKSAFILAALFFAAHLPGHNQHNILVQREGDGVMLSQVASDGSQKSVTLTSEQWRVRLHGALSVRREYFDAENFPPGLERTLLKHERAAQKVENLITRYGSAYFSADDIAALRADLASARAATHDQVSLGQARVKLNGAFDQFIQRVYNAADFTQEFEAGSDQGVEYNLFANMIEGVDLQTLGSFIDVTPGRFVMGSALTEEKRFDVEGQHDVTLTHSFALKTTEVTQAEWFAVMGFNAATFTAESECPDSHVVINGVDLCPQHPVEQVSWLDAQDFIARLNEADANHTYRLPTDAEWEYSARAGTETKYFFGDDDALMLNYGWIADNSDYATRDVATKRPNPWGFYDLYGNAQEWVSDYFRPNGADAEIDPQGPTTGAKRAWRPGGMGCPAFCSRSAARGLVGEPENFQDSDRGFRVVREARN